MKIVVTIPQGEVMDTFLSADTRKRLESLGTVVYNESTAQYTPDEVRELLRDAQVVVTGWGTPKLTGELLADNDSLRLIVHTGGSVADLVDEGTYAKGIRVLCGNDMFAESVAEGTIGYMLSALRRIPDDVFTLRNGGWKNGVVTRGLLGKQIGILGVGAIARHLMRMLQPFHCSFLVWDANYTVDPDYLASVNAKQVSLEEVLTSCNIISLHASLTPKSHGMIGRREFEMMQPGTVFINSARGAIIRQQEMAEVLRDRPELFAVLDVFEVEPLPTDDLLRTLDNVYLIPHRGGPTVDYREQIGAAVVEDIANWINGKELAHEIGVSAAMRMTSHKK
ncbi:MAG: hydroxyacid dehydrogenase [Clostridia bacterium]|nr:hydroxyacid dehydrogenase [Clostridia bacterium]